MCASWRWISTGADDPYWLYRDSPSHPIEEILKVLEEFRKAAKIKHAGFSNWSQSRAEEARLAADRRVFRVLSQVKARGVWRNPTLRKPIPTWGFIDESFVRWNIEHALSTFAYLTQADG
jgi:aryl-alcohol dehydrogenase-like predicted oxidoreductase